MFAVTHQKNIGTSSKNEAAENKERKSKITFKTFQSQSSTNSTNSAFCLNSANNSIGQMVDRHSDGRKTFEHLEMRSLTEQKDRKKIRIRLGTVKDLPYVEKMNALNAETDKRKKTKKEMKGKKKTAYETW